MKRIAQTVSTLTASVFILLGFTLVNHVSAMPNDVHDPNMKAHSAKTSGESKCISQCTITATGKKQDEINRELDNEDDDQPVTPYYIAHLRPSIDFNHKLASVRTKNLLRPPPKVPIYIALGVFRV